MKPKRLVTLRRSKWAAGKRIVRDHVDVTVEAAQKIGDATRILGRVIDPGQLDVLETRNER